MFYRIHQIWSDSAVHFAKSSTNGFCPSPQGINRKFSLAQSWLLTDVPEMTLYIGGLPD